MTSLDQYLLDISKEELLTPEEERELAVRSRAGDDEAAARLVRANTRFVVSVAKKYHKRTGLPLEDLISEGNVGLVRAAKKFDETKGVKFITYAVWWIRQGILQYLAEHGGQLRVPLNVNSARARIHKHVYQLLHEGVPNRAAYARVAHRMREEDLEKASTAEERRKARRYWTADRVADLYEFGRELSLDASISDDQGAGTRGERWYLPQPGAADDHTERVLLADALEQRFQAYIRRYGERDVKIMHLRHGLVHASYNPSGETHTLEEIGQLLGVTRERARQLEARFAERMRKQFDIGALREYVA